jgi:hypothetical protein
MSNCLSRNAPTLTLTLTLTLTPVLAEAQPKRLQPLRGELEQRSVHSLVGGMIALPSLLIAAAGVIITPRVGVLGVIITPTAVTAAAHTLLEVPCAGLQAVQGLYL